MHSFVYLSTGPTTYATTNNIIAKVLISTTLLSKPRHKTQRVPGNPADDPTPTDRGTRPTDYRSLAPRERAGKEAGRHAPRGSAPTTKRHTFLLPRGTGKQLQFAKKKTETVLVEDSTRSSTLRTLLARAWKGREEMA